MPSTWLLRLPTQQAHRLVRGGFQELVDKIGFPVPVFLLFFLATKTNLRCLREMNKEERALLMGMPAVLPGRKLGTLGAT